MSIDSVCMAMIGYFGTDVRRINHFVKVHSFAAMIGRTEQVPPETQKIIEIAALTHDIGIKLSEEKYNSAAGNYQEQEGPGEARKLLAKLNVDAVAIERVCWLIAHHHSYGDIRDIDLQILVEADFIVNAFEDELASKSIKALYEKLFRTRTGKALIASMYGFAG